MRSRPSILCFMLAMIFGSSAFVVADEKPAAKKEKPANDLPKNLYEGKVVLLREALEKRGIESRPEMDGQVVLEMPDGQLMPLVADWRGRAFYQDKKLRNRKVELIAQKPANLPYLQVLTIYTFDKKGKRQYTDYWCDICSIPMYEIKPCDCCQGDIRLRFQHQELPDYIEELPTKKPTPKSSQTPFLNKPSKTSH